MTSSQPASDFRYWAFVSYSHKDKSWGQWLHRALETYRVPKRLHGMPIAAGRIPRRLTPVFRDRDELPTASDLGAVIEDALSQSWCLIVICSPEAAKSRWINEEVLAFQRLGRGDRIHCLIVDSGGDSAAPIIFPSALTTGIKADGRPGEPVAADARRYGDGRSHALLKLIAGILGISYDTLFQREQQRRHRNLFTITCASLALVVVLAAATLIAVTSRRDAVDQRGHAESLVEFMIGDLRKKLEPDGKLATLDAVGKEALAYYAAQKSENLDAEALARRARALHMIGEVYDLRGDLDEALKVFEQAADSTAELLKREPDNGQRVFDHAQSVYWVGYIAYQRGSIGIAEPAFQEYKRLAEIMTRIDSANEDWQAEVGYANSNLGTLLYERGKLNDAAAIFASELSSASKLARSEPADFQRQMRVAQAHAWLGDVHLSLGDYSAAVAQRRQEIDIYSRELVVNPANKDAKVSMLISQHHQAFIRLSLGDVQAALDSIRPAIALGVELIEADPDNTRWNEVTANAYAALAEILIYSKEWTAAKEAATRAEALTAGLLQSDSSVLSWQRRWFASQLIHVRLIAAMGDEKNALPRLQKLVAWLSTLPEERMRALQQTVPVLRAYWLIGILQDGQGRSADAIDAWQCIVDHTRMAEGPADPSVSALRVLALMALGRVDEAKPISNWLAAIGYREPGYIAELNLRQKVPNSRPTGTRKHQRRIATES